MSGPTHKGVTAKVLNGLLYGIRQLFVNGEEKPIRSRLNIAGAATVTDDPDNQWLELTFQSAPLSDTLPAALGVASAGVASEAPRRDHVHAHGNQAGGSLHALAVAGGSAGFISGTQAQQIADHDVAIDSLVTTLAGIVAGITDPLDVAAAPSAGTSDSYAREDHVHALGPGPFGPTQFESLATESIGYPGGGGWSIDDGGGATFDVVIATQVDTPKIKDDTQIELAIGLVTAAVADATGMVSTLGFFAPKFVASSGYVRLQGASGADVYEGNTHVVRIEDTSGVSRIVGQGTHTTLASGAGMVRLDGTTGIEAYHNGTKVGTMTNGGASQWLFAADSGRAGFGFEATGASQYFYLRCGSAGAIYIDAPSFVLRSHNASATHREFLVAAPSGNPTEGIREWVSTGQIRTRDLRGVRCEVTPQKASTTYTPTRTEMMRRCDAKSDSSGAAFSILEIAAADLPLGGTDRWAGTITVEWTVYETAAVTASGGILTSVLKWNGTTLTVENTSGAQQTVKSKFNGTTVTSDGDVLIDQSSGTVRIRVVPRNGNAVIASAEARLRFVQSA